MPFDPSMAPGSPRLPVSFFFFGFDSFPFRVKDSQFLPSLSKSNPPMAAPRCARIFFRVAHFPLAASF